MHIDLMVGPSRWDGAAELARTTEAAGSDIASHGLWFPRSTRQRGGHIVSIRNQPAGQFRGFTGAAKDQDFRHFQSVLVSCLPSLA